MEWLPRAVAPPPPGLAPPISRNHLSRRANAMLTADQPPLDPPDTAAGTPVCEAAGCGRPLTPAQVARDARACSAACRARLFRERRKRARLADVDAAIRVLQELRQEIARG